MTTTDLDALRDRLQRLGFFGLISSWNDVAGEQWLSRLVEIEEKERKKRTRPRSAATPSASPPPATC